MADEPKPTAGTLAPEQLFEVPEPEPPKPLGHHESEQLDQ